eukprot:UN00158
MWTYWDVNRRLVVKMMVEKRRNVVVISRKKLSELSKHFDQWATFSKDHIAFK